MEEGVHHQEHVQVIVPSSRDNDGVSERDTWRPETSSSERPLLGAVPENQPTTARPNVNLLAGIPPPPPALSQDGTPGVRRKVLPGVLDHTRRTVAERLDPTIENALIEKDKYARTAVWTRWALNVAIGLQVLLGALTTGVAAAVTNARQAQISTSVLGGLATLVASYLARVRGSGEPVLSIARVKGLDQFPRECMAFRIDHAHKHAVPGDNLDKGVHGLRRRFEELLGNADAQRKLSPVGVSVGDNRGA